MTSRDAFLCCGTRDEYTALFNTYLSQDILVNLCKIGMDVLLSNNMNLCTYPHMYVQIACGKSFMSLPFHMYIHTCVVYMQHTYLPKSVHRYTKHHSLCLSSCILISVCVVYVGTLTGRHVHVPTYIPHTVARSAFER